MERPIIIKRCYVLDCIFQFLPKWIPYYKQKITPLLSLTNSNKDVDWNFPTNDFNETCRKFYRYISEKIKQNDPMLCRHWENILFEDIILFIWIGMAIIPTRYHPRSLRSNVLWRSRWWMLVQKYVNTILRLLSVAFGSCLSIGNTKYFHSSVGKAIDATSCILEKLAIFIGTHFYPYQQLYCLIWLMRYKDNDVIVKQLQLKIQHITIIIWMNMPTMSRLGEDMHINPLLEHHLSSSYQDYLKYHPERRTTDKSNVPGRRKLFNNPVDHIFNCLTNLWRKYLIQLTISLLSIDFSTFHWFSSDWIMIL